MSILLREIDYPESDGKPMAETPLHMRVNWDCIQMLNDWYADEPKAYIWGNMFLYYRRGDPTAVVAPDVVAIFGVDKDKPRDVFKIWQEKRKPSAVIEITSRSTRKEDQKDKFAIYRDELKVKEYFLFDPRAEYLKQALKGFRLRAGEYMPIAEIDGRVPSKVFHLHLQRNGKELRFWNPETAQWLPTPQESLEALRVQAEKSRLELDFERYKREIAQKEADRLRRELERATKQNND